MSERAIASSIGFAIHTVMSLRYTILIVFLISLRSRLNLLRGHLIVYTTRITMSPGVTKGPWRRWLSALVCSFVAMLA